jgi:hypothetical protein
MLSSSALALDAAPLIAVGVVVEGALHFELRNAPERFLPRGLGVFLRVELLQEGAEPRSDSGGAIVEKMHERVEGLGEERMWGRLRVALGMTIEG